MVETSPGTCAAPDLNTDGGPAPVPDLGTGGTGGVGGFGAAGTAGVAGKSSSGSILFGKPG